MITGGNSGIGKCVALEIAKRGGTVHLVCRNSNSAQEAQVEIQKATKNNVNIYLNVIINIILIHIFVRMFMSIP